MTSRRGKKRSSGQGSDREGAGSIFRKSDGWNPRRSARGETIPLFNRNSANGRTTRTKRRAAKERWRRTPWCWQAQEREAATTAAHRDCRARHAFAAARRGARPGGSDGLASTCCYCCCAVHAHQARRRRQEGRSARAGRTSCKQVPTLSTA